MLSALVILALQVERMRDAALDVKAAYEAIDVGHRLVRQFAEIQIAVHAYAVTGDARFMDAYQHGRREWSQAEVAASGSILQDPDRAERFVQVERDVDAFFTDWENRLGTFDPGTHSQVAGGLIEADRVRDKRISAEIAEFVRHEEEGILRRLAEEERARNRVYIGAVTTSGVAVAMLGVFATLLGRSIAKPIRRVAAAAQLLGSGQWGERVVPQGGRETRILAHAFNEMADALQEARSSLAARNRDLEQAAARLTTANEDLRDRQRESDDFLYVLSHDLRAPLINIQGFSKRLHSSMAALELGLGGPSAASGVEMQLARMKESLQFINAGAAKIDQLMARLLDIARLSTRPNERLWTDMERVARDVIGACQFQLQERGIEAVIEPLPAVYGDPIQLNQVLTNLVDNAVKYMGNRAMKRIRISCAEQGDRYRFAVQDTGPGIAARDQEKVFRMFARLAPDTSQGEGIGLAAVRAIVNRHGGRIWIESAAGAGATFYFTLPRHPESTPQAELAGVVAKEEESRDAGASG